MTKKTGLLLPRTVLYPSVNFDLLEGLRTGLESSAQQDISVLTENIGIGANDQLIYNSCERMLMDGCAVIAGYVNPSSALKLQPLFAAANAVFIAIDSGYQFMLPETQVLPNVIFVSMQGAFCCRATATLATRAGFRKFAYTSSFLDAGYRPAYSYTRAIEGNGAAIGFNHVSALKRQDFTIEPLTSFLTEQPEHAVVAAYCGDMLQDFCEHVSRTKTLDSQLFASPFMLEESWLEKSTYPGIDMHGIVTWARSLDNEVNTAFKKTMEERGRDTSIFAVLGYEAGQIVSLLLDSGKRGAQAIGLLKGRQIETPRGTVTIDADNHHTIAPMYHVKAVRHAASGNCALEIVCPVEDVPAQWQDHLEDMDMLKGASTNWLNTYPCIES